MLPRHLFALIPRAELRSLVGKFKCGRAVQKRFDTLKVFRKKRINGSYHHRVTAPVPVPVPVPVPEQSESELEASTIDDMSASSEDESPSFVPHPLLPTKR